MSREAAPWTDTDLPHIKLRRNPAGGYMTGRIGGLQTHPAIKLEEWLSAVNATPTDNWSTSTDWDGPRCFRQAHLESRRSKNYKRWLAEKREELREAARHADGLSSYEVAAFLGRSVRTARRFLRRIDAQRHFDRPNCFTRKWTARYEF